MDKRFIAVVPNLLLLNLPSKKMVIKENYPKNSLLRNFKILKVDTCFSIFPNMFAVQKTVLYKISF